MMVINCLSTQEGLFETRLLRHVFQPVFLAIEDVARGLDGPLVLYGSWHPQGFWNGLHWLSGLVYRLPHPCILLPPFESGSLSDVLGLATELSVHTINTNRLSILPDVEAFYALDKETLQIQTDYAFSGPTGKAWLAVDETLMAALTLIQPKNTSTPLLLCGARLLSASGLSDNDDRLILLERIMTWAWNWQPLPDQTQETLEHPIQMDDATWHVVCIVVAGSRLSATSEVISLARSLFGIEISPMEMQLALDRLVEYGLAQRSGEDLKPNLVALETYTQQHGLWAYVRALRKDFERIRP